MTVRYEDLKKSPGKKIGQMFDFAGLDYSSDLIAKIVQRTNFRNLKDAGAGASAWRGETGGWKEYFSKDDIKLFKEMAGDVLLKMGYIEW